jgi:hypothetical protein
MADRVSIRLDTWGDSCTVTVTSLAHPERIGEWHFTHTDEADEFIAEFRQRPAVEVAEEIWS